MQMHYNLAIMPTSLFSEPRGVCVHDTPVALSVRVLCTLVGEWCVNCTWIKWSQEDSSLLVNDL